jgi:myo-inositol-1-phosphate synthase
MSPIRIAIAGLGNCASSLVQGIAWYAARDTGDGADAPGLMHPLIGEYRVRDIEVVAAFDIDRRKVGRPVQEAIFAPPNNTRDICRDLRPGRVLVQMGPVLDGVAGHMSAYPPAERFEPADARPVDVARALRESGAQVLVNYMPVGAQQATEHYAEACLEAGVSLVNCVPVFIVSDPSWAQRFARRRIPCIGDDIKAQVGATITHRTLIRLCEERGLRIDNTYQLNVGGNTDFLNMLEQQRLTSKKVSKTEAVQSQMEQPLGREHIHVGPSDYVPFLKDNKVCFLRVEASGFAGIPMNMELRLSVEDSPNSAGVVVDAIRCCQLARDRGLAGPIQSVSAYTMKHPPVQMPDNAARAAMDLFIEENSPRDPAAAGRYASNSA